MTKLTILHLTDLHYDPSRQKDIDIVMRALSSDLTVLKNQGLKPNILIFSGDFIFAGDYGYSADRNDFETVKSKYIDTLLRSLDLDTNNLYICPGNHDIQRNRIDEYLEEGLKQKLINRDSVNYTDKGHKLTFSKV